MQTALQSELSNPLPVTYDPIFHLPVPPVNTVFNLAFANRITLVIGIFLLVFLAWRLSQPGRRMMTLAMILGGAGVTFNEPVFDALTGVWHPVIGQNVAYTLFGRSVPYWAFFGYMAVYGCSALLMLQAFMAGVTKRSVWLWCLIPIVIDMVIEMSLLQYKLYFYFANQPLDLFGFPIYQAPCNAIGIFFSVTVLYLISPYLKQGWKWFPAAIIIVPFCGGVGFIGGALPAAYVINAANVPAWLTQLGGLGSFVLMGIWVYGISLVVAVDSPHRYPVTNTPAAGGTGSAVLKTGPRPTRPA